MNAITLIIISSSAIACWSIRAGASPSDSEVLQSRVLLALGGALALPLVRHLEDLEAWLRGLLVRVNVLVVLLPTAVRAVRGNHCALLLHALGEQRLDLARALVIGPRTRALQPALEHRQPLELEALRAEVRVGLLEDSVACATRACLLLPARPAQPNFDVLRALQQPAVQRTHALRVVRLLRLEVDERLPRELGHVERGLADAQLVHGARALDLRQGRLERRERDPCGRVVRRPAHVLLVQRAAALDLTQLQLELDVRFEYLGLGRAADGHAEQLARGAQLAPAQLKVRAVHPQLAEGEPRVRHELARGGEHVAAPRVLLGHELLEDGVLEPQVDVARPVPLVRAGRHVRHGALVHVAHALGVGRAERLLEPGVVEPVVVLQRLRRHLLLVLRALLRDEHVLDGRAVAVRALEGGVGRAQLVQLRRGQCVQRERVLEDDARAFVLSLPLLERRERAKQLRAEQVVAQLLERRLVHGARGRHLADPLLPLGPAQVRAHHLVAAHVARVHGARARHVVVPLL
mmetsp:Transcript_5874/g.15054  ORF Transcript_5874/g.15054 Transcript_5874/m.15054 type:complete len:521 (-) Transcript_5874:636-2198(-)